MGSRLYVRFVRSTNKPLHYQPVNLSRLLHPFYYVISSPCVRIQNIEHAILRCPDSIHRVDRNELRDYEQVTTWRHENRSSKRVGVKSKSHLKSYVLIARKEILGRQKKKKRNFKVNFAACHGDAHSNGRLADSGDRRKPLLCCGKHWFAIKKQYQWSMVNRV